MDIRPRGVVVRRAFWVCLILLIVPIALAVVNTNPTVVSIFPTQTSGPIAVTMTFALTSGGAGSGSLTVSGQPPGVNPVPNPVTYTFGANQTSGSTSFQFAATATAAPGTYTVTISDNTLRAGSTTMTLIVNTPSFTANATPNPVTLVIGGAAQNVTVNTTVDPGFNAANVTYSFSGFPNFITIAPGGASAAGPTYPPQTFTFSLGAGAVAGTYNGTLTGTYLTAAGAPVSKTFPFAVVVQQPDISATFSNPAMTVCSGGAPVGNAINLAPLNGYSGTPTLIWVTSPPGITINPGKPVAAAMPPGQSLPFTVTAAPGASSGIATLNIVDAAANINKTINMSITVVQPDYTPSTTPGSVNLTAGGGSQAITASIAPNACFTSAVTVSASSAPGITFTPASGPAPTTFSVQAAANVAPGTYTATFTFTPAAGATKTTTATINVAAAPDFSLTTNPAAISIAPGESKQVTVSAAGFNGFAGTIAVTAPSLPGLTFSPGAFSLTPGASQTVTVTASPTITPQNVTGVFTGTAPGIAGSRIARFGVQVLAGPDFVLTANPTQIIAAAGSNATLTISVQPLNGFTGTVTVTAPNVPGLTFTPSQFDVPAGGSTTVQVAIAPGTSIGSITATFSGTAPGVGPHTTDVFFGITAPPDFALNVTPGTITIPQAGNGDVVVSATGFNSFTGPITVTATPSAGISVSPATFTLNAQGQQTVRVTVTTLAPLGGGNVVFTGTAPGVSGPRSATLSVNVSGRPDYSLFAQPPTIAIAAGNAGTVGIGLIPSNGFAGGVQVTATQPNGIAVTPLPFPVNATQPTPVTINVPANAVLGPMTIHFTAVNDPTHFVDVLVNVLAPRPVITVALPPAVATGDRSIVVRLLGRFFQAGARVTALNPGVKIERINVINSQTAEVTMSVNADATAGATTLTLTNPDGGSANTTLLVYPRGSIAAPLGVTTAAIVFPAEGTMIAPTQPVYPRGLLATTGMGTIIGVWKFDGVPFDRFTVNVGGGYPAEVRTHLPLPISFAGAHTLELQIEQPQFAAAPILHVLMAPNSVSRLTLLAPRDGAVIGTVSPLFRWSLVPNSTGYAVEIDNEMLPRRIRTSESQWRPSTQTLQELGPGIHRWRVRAVFPGETESEPTEWQRFAIVPQHVDLTTAVQQRRVSWRGGVSGLLYRVEVLDASGNVVYSALTAHTDFTIPPNIGGTSVRVTAIAPGGVTVGTSPSASVHIKARGVFALVQQKPAVTAQEPPNGSKVNTPQPHIAATWSGTVKPEEVAMTVDQTDVTAVSKVEATSIAYDSLLPLANGTHTVRLSLAGEVTAWTFDVEAAAEAAAAQPAASNLRKDWALTPNGTITVVSGNAQPDAARAQLSAQTDLANDANGAKVTGDSSFRHDINDPNKTVQESRNWLTDFTRQQGAVQGEAKIGYATASFLDQSELLASGVARGGVEGRVHLSKLIASGYQTFGTRPAGVLAGDFGPKQTIRAAALQTEPNDKWDFRLIGFRVTDNPGVNSSGGIGKAVGMFAKYVFMPQLSVIFEGSHGTFDPNPLSAAPKRGGSALRFDFSGQFGSSFNYVLNLRRTEANYVNPANRGLTPGGVPDRTGGNLSLTKVISKTSITLQLRTLRDGNSSGAVLPRNRENGGTLAIATSIGAHATLALGGNWTGDRGSGNSSIGLPNTDRSQSGANGTLTEAIGIFNLSQNVTVQKLTDRINPISDSTTTASTFTFGGTPTPNLNLNAVFSGTRTEGSSAAGTTNQYLASLQPSYTLPTYGVMLQPRANVSRSKNSLTNIATTTQQYQGMVTWAPPKWAQLFSLQLSADASRNITSGQPTPKFVHQYVGTLSLKWGAGSGQSMNGTTVVNAQTDVNATKTNNPTTTSAVSQ